MFSNVSDTTTVRKNANRLNSVADKRDDFGELNSSLDSVILMI